MSVMRLIEDTGLIPVVSVAPEKAVDLGRALKAGGVPIMEITFRREGAEKAIENVAKELPKVAVGAGTVLTVKQAEMAVDAGARFIVAPGYDPDIVEFCLKKGVDVVPGVSTASEITTAMKAGLKVLKLFPAESIGGVKTLKDFAGPFQSIRFITTGGMNLENLGEYTRQKNVLAVGGSFMAPSALISAGDFEGITALTKTAVKEMFGFKLIHMGINAKDKDQAREWAMLMNALFDFPANETAISYFASTDIEIMSGGGRGENGHIGIGTNCLKRALTWLEEKGYSPNLETARYDASGRMTFIYLDKDICGFAVHINQR